MGKSLETLVWERRKEAEGKNFDKKALRITDYLGHSQTIGHTKNNWYFDGLFEIESSWLSPDNPGSLCNEKTNIKYRDSTVFSVSNYFVTSYVPGEWEEEFEQLYRKAKRLKKRRKYVDYKQLDRNGIKAKWGL